jgi:hypothetical protein
MAAILGFQQLVRAGDAPPATTSDLPESTSTFADAVNNPPVKLEPMIVGAPKIPGFLGKVFGYSWSVSEYTQDSNFHLRHGELINAIGFRHVYLEKHPAEKATVVVVTTDSRVTQAVVAYTDGPRLHLMSVELGDIQPEGMTAADVDHTEVIRKYIQSIRDANLENFKSLMIVRGSDQQALDRATHRKVTVPISVLEAGAEETGDYSALNIFGQPLYRGSSDDMLLSAFYWLNNKDKVGLIPVARNKVNVDISSVQTHDMVTIQSVTRDSVLFDWDGVHYLYNDQDGVLSLPIPKNPITGVPYLVIRQGDLFECLYFDATYLKQHPDESVALIPSLDGVHAAAAFTQAGKLSMISPFLGRFAVPPRFKINQIGELAKLHEALIEREMKKSRPGKSSRPETGLPESLPGDSATEQVRRAYLAFESLGLSVEFFENDKEAPGLKVLYHGTEYSYSAPN